MRGPIEVRSGAQIEGQSARAPLVPWLSKPCTPLTKRLTPMPDGGLLNNDELWLPGSKTIEQRTRELLDNGYGLVSTRIDDSRLFERRTKPIPYKVRPAT